MAIYEYQCNGCGVDEVMRSLADKEEFEAHVRICLCGGRMKRVWHAPGVHYRAPGFTKATDDPGGAGYGRKQRARERRITGR